MNREALTLSSLIAPDDAVSGAFSNRILTMSSAVRNGSEMATNMLNTNAQVMKTKPGMK